MEVAGAGGGTWESVLRYLPSYLEPLTFPLRSEGGGGVSLGLGGGEEAGAELIRSEASLVVFVLRRGSMREAGVGTKDLLEQGFRRFF